jgi:hypothetical protein
MSRKIYITEAQLRNLIRSKINENIATNETNKEDVYRTIIDLVNNSELSVEDYEWEDNETLKIEFSFDKDSDGIFILEVVITGEVDYSYSYSRGDYYTPDDFEESFDFSYSIIRPDDITIINLETNERIEIDNNTYEAIIEKVRDNAIDFYEKEFDYDEYRDHYCYDDRY